MPDALAAALALHRAGDLAAARSAYLDLLDRHPDHPDALHLLGVLEHQAGSPAVAVDHLLRAVELMPDFAAARTNLGNVLMALGQAGEAVTQLEKAVELDPENAIVRVNLSHAHLRAGHPGEALREAMLAADQAPDLPATRKNLGALLADLGLAAQAEEQLLAALALDDKDQEALLLLADIFERQGQAEDAAALLDRALADNPEQPLLQAALGNLYARAGDPQRAVGHLSAAARQAPQVGRFHNDLGLALTALGLTGQAANCFETATRADPGDPAGWVNLANSRRAAGAFAQAAEAYRSALDLAPDLVEASSQLGAMLLLSLGDSEAALPWLERAAAASPPGSPHRSAPLLASQYCASRSGPEIGRAHAAWGRAFDVPPRPPVRPRQDGAPLRVGLVSGDYRNHAARFLLTPLLRHRDRQVWTAILYSNTANPDAWTRKFESLADGFVDISRLDDAAAQARIEADRIDILIDLNGHTWGNRLPLFARRPAPIQASWLDYVGSTGLPQIDAVFMDACQLPAERFGDFVEPVLYFPVTPYCYAPPEDAPHPAPPPSVANGFVTFGSCNGVFKLSEPCLELWAKILNAAPDSRLVLRSPGLEFDETTKRIERLFAARGVAADRLSLYGRSSHADMLAGYAEIDIALDSLPYSGGLTTLEALWMGVPVVTCPGDRVCSNHATSHLRAAGLDDLVAANTSGYAAKALALAADPVRLATFRDTLRSRLEISPLTDGPAHARAFESLLQELLARVG